MKSDREKKKRASGRLGLLAAALTLIVILCCFFGTKSYSFKDAKKGVVNVLSVTADDAYQNGSGFGVGKTGKETDIYVTNRHVVWDDDADKLAEKVYILLEDDAEIVTYDYTNAYYMTDDDGNQLTDTSGNPVVFGAKITIDIDYSKAVECEIL